MTAQGGPGGGEGNEDSGLGGATGADRPGASERTRIGELYGEVPPGARGATVPGGAADASGADASGAGASGTEGAGAAGGGEPLVRVVRGEPDAIELAALIAGLTAAAVTQADAQEAAEVRHRWSDRSHALRGGDRGMPARGPNAWRWSLHP